eukprot:5076419-Amphidinium_carterae.1
MSFLRLICSRLGWPLADADQPLVLLVPHCHGGDPSPVDLNTVVLEEYKRDVQLYLKKMLLCQEDRCPHALIRVTTKCFQSAGIRFLPNGLWTDQPSTSLLRQTNCFSHLPTLNVMLDILNICFGIALRMMLAGLISPSTTLLEVDGLPALA